MTSISALAFNDVSSDPKWHGLFSFKYNKTYIILFGKYRTTQLMTSQLMTLSSGFKEKNGFYCLARARKNMKNTKDTVYHCHNCCEMFSQFDVCFWDLYILIISHTTISDIIIGTFAPIIFMTAPSPLFNVGYRKEMLYVIASLFYSSHSITTTLKRGRGVFNWLIYSIL